MALDATVKSWVDRFYFKGIGLQVPGKLPGSEADYNTAFNHDMLGPVQAFMGSAYSVEEIPTFLKSYQSLGKITAFNILAVLKPAAQDTDDWKTKLRKAYQNTIKDAEVWWCLAKNGQLFRAYVKDGKVIGKFDKKVAPIAKESEIPASMASNFISDLLTKDVMSLTDTECEFMRRIFKVDNNYNSRLTKAEIEIFENGAFVTKPVSPIGTSFPPYKLRKLWMELPTTNQYPTKHEQAYRYLLNNPNGYEDILEYLKPMFDGAKPRQGTTYTQIPEEGGSTPDCAYDDLGQLLQSYVADGSLSGYWTIDDVINWYVNDVYPMSYNPKQPDMDTDLEKNFINMLQHLINISPACAEWPLDAVLQSLITGDDYVEKPIEFDSLQDLLDSKRVHLSDECFKEVTDLKANARQYLEENYPPEIVAKILDAPTQTAELLSQPSLDGYPRQVKDVLAKGFDEFQKKFVPAHEPYGDIYSLANSSEVTASLSKQLLEADNVEAKASDWLFAKYGEEKAREILAGQYMSLEDELDKLGFSTEEIDVIKKGDKKSFLVQALCDTGFDSKLAESIASGELPMDNVTQPGMTVVESKEDPFDAVMNSTNLQKRKILARKILESDLDVDPNEAYRITEGLSVEKHEEVHNDLPNTTEESDDYSVLYGTYLLNRMRSEFKRIDALPRTEMNKERSGLVPLFYGLVSVFASPNKTAGDIPKTLQGVHDNPKSSQLAKDIIDETVTRFKDR